MYGVSRWQWVDKNNALRLPYHDDNDDNIDNGDIDNVMVMVYDFLCLKLDIAIL